MLQRPFFFSLAIVVLWGLLTAPALGQAQRVPSERHSSVAPTSAVPLESLHRVDTDALRTEAETKENRVGPYQFATDLDTDFTSERHGRWERLSPDKWLWRLRIRSEDALSLNLAFTEYRIPEDGELYVYDPEKQAVHGPYKRDDATNGQLWTPIVPGSEVIVEVTVPTGRRSQLSLGLTQVNHGFRSQERTLSKRATAKARACNIDVACPQADPWRDHIHSVGFYSITGTDLCSGALVNNTGEDKKPYFLTAEHCVRGSESRAASMVFYWNYQNPTCRPPGSNESGTVTSDDKSEQTMSGALLRMSYGNRESGGEIAGKPDITLVEIDDIVPGSYNLFLSGWDRTDFAPSEAVSIHHPQLHGKRITFEYDQTEIEGYLGGAGDTHIHVNWDDGTTEGGSSGSPLYAPSKKIVGVLSGGNSGCEIQDWYGRVHKGWEGGGTSDTRLRDWLDPAGTGAQTLTGQYVVAPPPPSGFRVENITSRAATLRWKAPEDDGSSPTPDEYDLRMRSKEPIETLSEFQNARRISDVPAPGPPGSTQSLTIDLEPDTSYYFAIRTLDTNKNASVLAASEDATPVSAFSVKPPPSPNPTSGRTTFGFVAERRQSVAVELFDTMGRRIRTLFNDDVQPFRKRSQSVDLSPLSSGIYFLRIRGESTIRTEKIVLTK